MSNIIIIGEASMRQIKDEKIVTDVIMRLPHSILTKILKEVIFILLDGGGTLVELHKLPIKNSGVFLLFLRLGHSSIEVKMSFIVRAIAQFCIQSGYIEEGLNEEQILRKWGFTII